MSTDPYAGYPDPQPGQSWASPAPQQPPPPPSYPPPTPPVTNGVNGSVTPGQPPPGSAPMSAIPYAAEGFGAPEPEPLPLPTLGSADPTRTHAVRIGLWGSGRAGKSTYLAALPIAGMQSTADSGRWAVSGVGRDAEEYLVQGVEKLAQERCFPPATLIAEPLTWAFHGPPPPDRLFNLGRREGVEFALELQDVPGEFFRTGVVSEQIVDHLANSQGLIYLFDPIGDAEDSLRSFNFFYAMLQAVQARVRDSGRLLRNRLPHHVAVCVTKFDQPEFFDAALRAHWVTQDRTGSRLPTVPKEQSAGFFDWVCRVHRGGTAMLIQDAFRTFFHPDRVRHYATSAIGFRLNRNQIFDYRDYRNVEQVNGMARIRTTPRPLNVLEPLIDLERRISGRRK